MLKRFTPSEGQELAMSFLKKAKYALLAMKPGQGKTLCAVEYAVRNNLRLLVICPGYARSEWTMTMRRQKPNAIIENFKKRSDIYDVYDADLMVISYEMLYDPKLPKNDQGRNARKLAMAADIIAVDEVQYAKSMESKRSEYLHKLVYECRPDYLALLTGTPIKNRIEELYSICALCYYKFDDPDFLKKYPKVFQFASEFSYPTHKQIRTKRGIVTTIVYEGSRNLEKLKEYISWFYFTMPKRLEFKLKERDERFIEADKMPSIPELEAAFMSFISNKKSSTPEVKAQAALITAQFTAKIAKELKDAHGSIVIFTDHQKSCDEIAQKLKVPAIHGAIPIAQRNKTLKAFQDGKSNFIVATYGTLSTAISLIRSHVMILNDPPWVPGDLDQTMARIDRKGQTKSCIYYKVLATKQSERIYKVLKTKSKTIKKLDKLMQAQL